MKAISPTPPVLVVDDVGSARLFYVRALGCRVMEARVDRLDLELCGHPLRLVEASARTADDASPEAAFVLRVDDWCSLSERLREHAVEVDVEPGRRFSVVPGEQCAMRLSDPDGNAIALLGFALEADQMAA